MYRVLTEAKKVMDHVRLVELDRNHELRATST